jgi:hypothetical protein
MAPRGCQSGAAEQRCRRSAERAATSAAERGKALPARSQGCPAGLRRRLQRAQKRSRSTVSLTGTERNTEQRPGQGFSNASRRSAQRIGTSCQAAAAAAPHASLSCSSVEPCSQQRARLRIRAALAPAAHQHLTCWEQRSAAARPARDTPRRAAHRALPPFLTHARPFGTQEDGARALWRPKLVLCRPSFRRARPPSCACCTAPACPAARGPLAALCRTRCASAAPSSRSTSTPRARSTCRRRSAMSSTRSSCGACSCLCCARGRSGRLVAGASRCACVCRH